MKKHNNEENDLSLEQRIFNMITLEHAGNTPFCIDKVEIMLKLAEMEAERTFLKLSRDEFLLVLNQQTSDVQGIIARQLVGSVDIENRNSDLEEILIFVAAIKHLLSAYSLYYMKKDNPLVKREEGPGC
jgi:hypothetical protein